jgi:dTDP-4-amino-4,6-dideoxygalactose transaminase
MDKLAILGGTKTRNRPFVNNAIVGKEEKRRVLEVLDSGLLSGFVAKKGESFLGGKQVKELEALLEGYFKSKYAVSVNSATAGLHIALGACGIGPGDEVIVSPYTMSASATAIVMLNAIPVFADIEKETFCIDPKKIEKAITPKTKAIVVVHLFGHPAAMDDIMKIARKHNIRVVEDCAQAPGAIYKGRLVGTIGDIGVFSFNQHKTITCGEGGFAITDNEELALRMQLIRNHGEVIVGDMGSADITNMVGYNYRMTELEAAVSIGQFKRLDFLNDHRIKLAEYLTDKLSQFKGLVLPKVKNNCKHVFFVYSIRFQEKIVGVPRDVFIKALNAEGIPFGMGYVKPIYLEPMYQKKLGYGDRGCPFSCNFYKGKVDYKKGLCPVAESMYEKELIATGVCRYPHKKSDVDDVVKAFKKVFKNIDKLKSEDFHTD